MTLSLRAPFPDLAVNGSHTSWQTCLAFNDAALKWILFEESIKTVLVSATFSQSAAPAFFTADGAVIASGEKRKSALGERVGTVQRQLAAARKRLVIVSPPQITGEELSLCYVQMGLSGAKDGACDFPVREFRENRSSSEELVEALENFAPVA